MKIADKLHPLERKVLPVIAKESDFDTIVKTSGLQDIEVMRAIQWLENKGLAKLSETVQEMVSLGKNGKNYVKCGLPERRFLEAIGEGNYLDQISKKAGLDKNEINICLGTLKKKAAIDIIKEKDLNVKILDNGRKLLEKGFFEEEFLAKDFPLDISNLKDEERFSLENLKKRNDIVIVELVKHKTAILTDQGKKVLRDGIDQDSLETLTPAMLKNKSWQGKKFRGYDVSINVPQISGGRRHFVNEAINYIRKIWLEMGFCEMNGSLVQTAFWDLDSLYVPQDHPARAMQDTFYIKDPKKGKLPEIAKTIKKVHESGGNTGSTGWQIPWSEDAAQENLLRTHTTVLSAQAIHALKKTELPAKFFSVNLVFRNEAVDWKHLFEFNQVEGIVVDPNANLRHLFGYLKEFYKKMGYLDVRMKPSHFPYTEPSMEVEVLHPVRKEWIELGGSGIFRPEVVKPLLGIDVPVLAWGQGMERIITEYFKINNLRDLYSNDLKQLRTIKAWMR